MLIKQYRKQKGLTQEALAEQVGINYRSLQDYEQGHKKLSSANGDTLLRLATALGCSIEELLMQEVSTMHSTRMRKENTISSTAIHNQIIHCPKYKLHGKFICCNDRITILFYYKGQKHFVPFDAVFTDKTLPWLKQSAALVIEEKIEEHNFMQSVQKGDLWNG